MLLLVTEIPLPPNPAADHTEHPFSSGAEFSITIDNDAFDDAHDYIVRNRDFQNVLFILANTGTLNSTDIRIYGTAVLSETPPAFSSVFELLANGVFSIRPQSVKSRDNTIAWSWILIRAKRTLAGITTTLDIGASGDYD